ncbi:FkbM family methyltransferase [Azospirillum doebereinerae]
MPSSLISFAEKSSSNHKDDDHIERRKLAEAFLHGKVAGPEILSGNNGVYFRGLAETAPHKPRMDSDLSELLLSKWHETETPALEVLMAAMVCANPQELPFPPPFSAIPSWLRVDWLKFLLRPPLLFREMGERERYADTFIAITDRVHEIVVSPPFPEALDLAEIFRDRGDPLPLYFSDRNLRDVFRKRAEIFEALSFRISFPMVHFFPPSHRKKPRVGILLGALLPGTETFYVFSHLSRELSERFEVTLFLLNNKVDAALLRAAQETGATVMAAPPGAVSTRARWFRLHDLDLLLIAANSTLRSESAYLSMCRIARVQVVGAASPISPGYTQGDVFLLGEGNATAADARAHYTEKLHLMPGLCTHYTLKLGDKPATIDLARCDITASHDDVILFSTANFYKITADLVALWARILWIVPNTTLVVMPFNPNWSSSYANDVMTDFLRNQLAARGVSPQRLRILSRVPERSDVQRVMALADVYLDSHPFAGACSMVDPLEVGVPVVVRDATTFRGGIAAAMLRELGLGDMVASDEEAYVKTAVRLAKDPALRAAWRQRINAVNKPLPYGETASYAHRFADACDTLVREDRADMAQRLAMQERTRRTLTALVDRLAAQRSPWLRHLTDTSLITLLILPYFQALEEPERKRLLIDVGACVGAFAKPFLSEDWEVHMMEPDSACAQAMAGLVGSFPGQAHHHAMVAVDEDVDSITFHRSATGLSGIGPSPYAETQEKITLPAIRLDEFVRLHKITSVDLLKVDAEGFDFRVLNGHDFVTARPRLVMVEFGDMYLGQERESILAGVAVMAERGYDALILSCDDDGNFKHCIWDYRLSAVTFDEPRPSLGGQLLGNVIFFPRGEPLLPALLLRLIESFLPGAERSALWDANE